MGGKQLPQPGLLLEDTARDLRAHVRPSSSPQVYRGALPRGHDRGGGGGRARSWNPNPNPHPDPNPNPNLNPLTLTRWPRTRAPRMRTTEARLPHRTSEPRPEDGPGAHVKARMMYWHPTYHPSTVTRHEDGWLRRRRSPGALVRPRAGDRPRVGPRCVVCSALSYETRADTVFFWDSAARDRNTANRDSVETANARKTFRTSMFKTARPFSDAPPTPAPPGPARAPSTRDQTRETETVRQRDRISRGARGAGRADPAIFDNSVHAESGTVNKVN